MRLEELMLRIPGDEFRVRFHEHLTVLSGIGLLEREALADSIVRALAGNADGTELCYRDNTGRELRIVGGPGGGRSSYTDDGSPGPPILGTCAASEVALRSLVVLRAEDLGLDRDTIAALDDPELAEARAALAELSRELQTAIGVHKERAAYAQELEQLDRKLAAARARGARHEYETARFRLAQAEAEARRNDDPSAVADRRLLDRATPLTNLVAAWEATSHRAAAARAACDASSQPAAVATVLADDAAAGIPAQPPADLGQHVDALRAARSERARLTKAVRELAGGEVAAPSEPAVVALAAMDQNALWQAADAVDRTAAELERLQLALGMAGPSDDSGAVAQRIEEEQHVVERWEAVLERQWTPTIAASALVAVFSVMLATLDLRFGPPLLVAAVAVAVIGIGRPYRELHKAQRARATALADAGADTYLGFHLRRVEATTDRDARGRLEAVALAAARAAEAWASLAPAVDVEQARRLEPEVRAFAFGLARQEGSVEELAALRAQLSDVVEPAERAARAHLAEALAPFDVSPATVRDLEADDVDDLVAQRIDAGHRARALADLDAANEAETAAAGALHAVLDELGMPDGSVEARVTAAAEAIVAAEARLGRGCSGRTHAEITADIARLRAEVEALHQPEFDEPDETPIDLDVVALEARRDQLIALGISTDADAEVIDLERLADRHSDLEQHVAALEAGHKGISEDASISQLADVQQLLLGHLASTSNLGPAREVLPVVLDEPFLRIAAGRKWELLDMLRRLGERTQLVYLTDDPYVTAWARRRASAGLVTLLEPVDA